MPSMDTLLSKRISPQMFHYSREVVEGYTLEIISRCQVTAEKCQDFLSRNYASEAPLNLSKTLSKMCSYLETAVKSIYNSIPWDGSNEEILTCITRLRDADIIVKKLAAHLRYVDGATTRKLPWSLIKPFAKLTNNLIPNTTVMLRPQWKYNYTVVTKDIKKAYYEMLYEFQDDISGEHENLEDVLKNMTEPFHIISFPSLERKNILLHCLLGHEIGHLVSQSFFTNELDKLFNSNNRERIINSVMKDDLPPDNLFTPVIIQKRIQLALETAIDAWKRGLEELLADIIGTMLFGTAVLFSTLEIALQDDLDSIPRLENNFYPPWRMRIREILKIIEHHGTFFPLKSEYFENNNIRQKVNARFDLIKRISDSKCDREKIDQDPILSIAYKQISNDISTATVEFRTRLLSNSITPDSLYRHLPHLIERINNGIPPNAYEPSVKHRETASLVEIINAAWFHRVSWENDIFTNDGTFNKH
ncbi:MAG: hypothetical protein SCARUB_05070 [Candidatus Scalindua rubra]|uniref:Uncharacterized protein n=1 Tax=Candidatus Scalindua rubra TaxID=1872076 RepID=A0A1E3X2I8_9BACT|nr:MAG: hypothetical protein SCARUB_05070 [Candidatus Scalindua rubra]